MQSQVPEETDVQHFIHAQSSTADRRTQVLLHKDTFAVFSRKGDIQPLSQHGIFYNEMRHLSLLEMRLAQLRPLLLSSMVREDNLMLSVDLTNPDISLPSGDLLRSGTLHIYRRKFLMDGICFDYITVHNYGQAAVSVDLSFDVRADFADIFEVRGTKRDERGRYAQQEVQRSSIVLGYHGLDGIFRRTRIESSVSTCAIGPGSLCIPVNLEPQEEMEFSLNVICESDDHRRKLPGCDEALRRLAEERHASPLAGIKIQTSNEQFNDWLNRSLSDLEMMVAQTASGPYPYAGVPWFSTVFGRDGMITALELLWLVPAVAKGVLSYLAATQATDEDPERDAEPGKILHEARKGEMANVREVPFGRYYGSVDSTPLFVMLAAAYYERTADREFLRQLWPNIEAALEWIDRYGDIDGDGFVEYDRRSKDGLVQQGWKDSQDSVFYDDGSIACPPIALSEVQGYVYAAKSGIAEVAADLGFHEQAKRLQREAEELGTKFRAAFWSDELSTFALALDGRKSQCQVHSSNAGQCLLSGIATPVQAQSTVRTLLSPSMFSGWGVRTVATREKRYNPMSYHNGSVWPHDNALIALGTLRMADKELALRILTGLLDMSLFVDMHRLPELICGFSRRPGKGPTLYPVACSPQAWAAGSVFLTLQSCLGLSIHAKNSRICLQNAVLPESLKEVRISNIAVGDSVVDLALERYQASVGVNIVRRIGEVEIVVVR